MSSTLAMTVRQALLEDLSPKAQEPSRAGERPRPAGRFRQLAKNTTCLLPAACVSALMLCWAPAFAQWPPADEFSPEPNGYVYATAVQPDGKILVGGTFTVLAGQNRPYLGRLYPDGTLDPTFEPALNGAVNSIALQPDGKILVGGTFTNVAAQARARLARLNPDGTLDLGFNPGANGSVYAIAVEPDGKILLAGAFINVAGQSRARLARLNPDGTLDLNFNPGANSMVYALALQPDGRILVGGNFTSLGGQSRARLARLNPDGSLDQSFNPGANSPVYAVAVQPDGKIVVGGFFTTLGGMSRLRIGRLHLDGSLDDAFNPGASASVESLAVQADGRIVVGGAFTNLAGQARSWIGRLNPDGSLDANFDPGADGSAQCIALQADGKILVGGSFTNLAGHRRPNLGRLNNTEPASESLTFDESTITWLRSGTAPEVWRTTFELSTNLIDWVPLGEGTRIPGGWQLTGLSVPTNARVRARGYTTGGRYNSSGWFVEAGAGSPWLVSQPTSRTNPLYSVATFHAWALGSGPLSYQWFEDGLPLADGGKVTGAGTPTLTLSNVAGAEMGAYWVVVTSPLGSLTSAVARLTVLDPWITSHPQSADLKWGETVSLSVAAVGTPPFNYQWYQDGAPVPGAAESTLTLTNVGPGHAGRYWAAVSNPYGTVTSQVALVTVNQALVDPDFDPGADADVLAMAIQQDGKIVLGGAFTNLGGQTRFYIARLAADGTVDPTFNPGADYLVRSLAVQPDGKILVGGDFVTLAGQSCVRIGRLNPDGTLDSAFSSQANGSVASIARQPDGKLVVGGYFTNLTGQPRLYIGRLNPDGTLDSAFNPGASYWVYSIALQPDGRILVGGEFTTLAGQSRSRLGRLNPDGTLDSTFNPGPDNWVSSILVQPDGKIVVSGGFTNVAGQQRMGIARLTPDGSLDPTFNPEVRHSAAIAFVSCLALQADGRILVGGQFTSLAGQGRLYVGRLEADGTADLTFNPGANNRVRSFALQPDGRIVMGGSFTNLGGQPRRYIARLSNTGPATESLTVEGSTITWLRGGTAPEVWRTTFELSTNGLDWVSLGHGQRIPGGWQLTGVALPPAATIRARGWVRAAYHTSSEWFVESLATVGAPLRLSIRREGGQVVLSWTGGQAPYQVQQCTDLSDPAGWTDWGEPVTTNSITLPIGPRNLFLRVRGH